MNRETKRLLAKQQAQDARRERPQQAGPGAAGRGDRKKRTPPRQFLREVRVELKKVAWPSRTEVTVYTAVVLVATVFLTLVVFGMDYGFAKAILKVFTK